MIAIEKNEYRQLEIDSSNLLLEADRWRTVGRYELSAYAMFNAGKVRLRMGQIVFNDNAIELAAEDWLSSADCFLRATDDKRAEVPLDIVRRLRDDGRIPVERADLHQGIKERQRSLSELQERVRNFLRGLASSGFRLESPSQESLSQLLRHVPDLPGYPQLHYLIYRQASALKHRDLAAFHVHWAATFEPGNANYVALLGYEFIEMGKPESALSLGRDYLVGEQGSAGQVRIMIANAMAATTGRHVPDQEGAIRMIFPLTENNSSVPIRQRIAAMALCAVFRCELSQFQEAYRLLDEITDIAYATGPGEALEIVSKFREMLPQVEPTETGPRPTPVISEDNRLAAFAAARELAVAS